MTTIKFKKYDFVNMTVTEYERELPKVEDIMKCNAFLAHAMKKKEDKPVDS